jgi:hypothetical protein
MEMLKMAILDRISLPLFCKSLQERLNEDWDVVIAITGEVGVGKSTLGGLISKEIDKMFCWIKNVAYLPTYREIEDKFFALRPLQAFLIDEAIKVLYKLKWADKLQIRINEMYLTERWQNKITLMCIPRFSDFNEQFRNNRVKIWIHIIARGLAVVFIREDVNIFQNDPWRLKENSKIVDKFLKSRKCADLTEVDKLSILSKSMNFWFYLEFGDLPEEDKMTYQEMRAKMREVKEDGNMKTREMIDDRNRFIYFVYSNCYTKRGEEYVKISESEIADIFQLSQQSISHIIKRVREEEGRTIPSVK